MSQYNLYSSLLNIPAVELTLKKYTYTIILSCSDLDTIGIPIVLISFTYHFIKCYEYAK